MYKSLHRMVPENTKYTDFVQKLGDDQPRSSSPVKVEKPKPKPTPTKSKPPPEKVRDSTSIVSNRQPVVNNIKPTNASNKSKDVKVKSTKLVQEPNAPISRSVKMKPAVPAEASQPSVSNPTQSTKFADLFSPEESNALKLYLLQKASSAPNISDFEEDLELASNIGPFLEGRGDNAAGTLNKSRPSSKNNNKRRRSAGNTSSPVVAPSEHPLPSQPPQLGRSPNNLSYENKLRTSSESVANLVYSTIRNDFADNGGESNPVHLNTGSDSKQDYDPHERLPSVDQMALRHELLNNIRAISRATYFEDLYTGKTTTNDGSPEAEILDILENSSTTLQSEDPRSRVDSWVRDSVASLGGGNKDEEDMEIDDQVSHILEDDPQSQNNRHAGQSLFHESVWTPPASDVEMDPDNLSKKTNLQHKNIPVPVPADRMLPSLNNKPTAPTNTNNHNNLIKTSNSTLAAPVSSSNAKRPFSFNTDGTVVYDSYASILQLPPAASNKHANSQYYNNGVNSRSYQPMLPNPNQSQSNTPSSFSRHVSVNEQVGRSHLPRVIPKQTQQQPYDMRNQQNGLPNNTRQPRINKLSSMNSISSDNIGVPRKLHPSEMERHKRGLNQHGMEHGIQAKYKIPRIYQRQNMNQWVAKKVWFYMNGDERMPRIEYRFRPRDLQTMDGLLNLLNKKMPQLPAGARYLFTSDGRLVTSVDDLQNEQSYIVSSTRKFKVRYVFVS